jgi:hypothetical protein
VIDERNEAYEEAHEVEEASDESEGSEEVSIPFHHMEEAREEIVPIRSIAPTPAPIAAPVRASSLDIPRNSTPIAAAPALVPLSL